MPNPKELICICMDVTRDAIERAIPEHGCKTIECIGKMTGAGTNCGGCHYDMEKILIEVQNNGR